MQKAFRWFLGLGGTAAALLAATPSATEAAASAELPGDHQQRNDQISLVHIVRAGDTLNRLAVAYRETAGWFSQADLLAAIRRQNELADERRLRIGQSLNIPVWQEQAPPRAARPTTDGSDLRGIYLPGPVCAYQSVFARIDSFTVRGGNGVVFDAKDVDGGVTFRSAQPLASLGRGRSAPLIGDLSGFLQRLKRRDLWVAARVALFLDGELGVRRPDLALLGPDGEPWIERDCVWLDPAAPEVRDYLIGLAVELARAGVDEVKLDYVRFPTNGWRGDCRGDLAATAACRREIITSFVATVHDTLRALGCLLSADLYGIMAWDRIEDLALTGQHVPSLAAHLDVICPMIYPSHFAPGFEGLARPGDHPEYIIAEGLRRFRAQSGDRILIRPWLQAFVWGVADYGPGYVSAQIGAARAGGSAGWCLWNPAGRYETAMEALKKTSPVLALDTASPVAAAVP